MSTSPLKQIPADCPDAELSDLVAEHVAGWSRDPKWKDYWIPPGEKPLLHGNFYTAKPPKFATSADAVLPLLENWPLVETVKNVYWRVSLFKSKDAYASAVAYAEAPTFARAACFCLLKDVGFTVLDAAGNGRAK